MLSALPALSEHRRVRLAVIFLLYVSQGIPLGLAMVAIPAWLTANGASAAQVGTFIGTALLPWSLKLVNGMVMDRFCYRPMGRKRAWLIGAQLMMVAILVLTAILNPGASDITLLAGLCFMLNLCATFNDVGVDGMAVDLVPEDEREGTNAYMFGGQSIGLSGSAALAAATLLSGGVALAAVTLAIIVALITLLVAVFRERSGERLLPWTAGKPSAECLARGQDSWLPILSQVLRGLLRWRTLLFLAGTGLIAASAGMADTVGPSFSVGELGWGSEDYSNFYSISGLITAIAAIILIAPLTSRFGPQRIYICFAALMVFVNLAAYFALTESLDTLAMQVYLATFWAGYIVTAILACAWSMNLTNPAVAASQFALFMAIPNLVRSFAAGGHGHLIESYGYGASFLVAAISVAAGLCMCLFAGMGRTETVPKFEEEQTSGHPDENAPLPQGLIG